MMKINITLTLLCLISLSVFAQINIIDNKVGIGDFTSTTPAKALHVKGDIIIPNEKKYLSFRSDGVTKQQLFVLDSNNDLTFNRSAITADHTSALIFGCADEFIDFRDKHNGVIMRMDHDTRYVGIGTLTPSERLEVSGNIKANNVMFQSPNDGETYLSIRDVATIQQQNDDELKQLKVQLSNMQVTVTALQEQNQALQTRLTELERQ